MRAVEEKEIIARCLAGDQQAFALLITRYKRMVHTVTSRVLRNTLDAEETTQDVFVKAFQKLSEFQGNGKFSTWLYSIAYRSAISALRVRKDSGRSLDELKDLGVEPSEETIDHLDERKRILEHALAELRPDDAAIVTMYHLDELSVDEIVTVTQLSASNVKVKLHRSRKKLHAILSQQLKEELWTVENNA